MREVLRWEVWDILQGNWKFFGRLEVRVDDPPRWQKDYLAGVDMETDRPAAALNHRRLPQGADIKAIWELSRWSALVRLAQAAYLLADRRAGETCVRWLHSWLRRNPPYCGWNWTSALESGIRLIQFCWIDALIKNGESDEAHEEALDSLRRDLLPAHVRFTWRHRSFGSSANNHLMGELTGLILAVVRWPELVRWAAPLSQLQESWEREVLTQFAEDGGNREQALHYHLFCLEFCLQAQRALESTECRISRTVMERLARAAEFYRHLQVPSDPWDHGDSDSAWVTPLFQCEENHIQEWHAWLTTPDASPALQFWLGDPPDVPASRKCRKLSAGWLVYPDSGMAMLFREPWQWRFDLSPLGFLSTAAHGHLDVLHLSLWINGQAVLVDPGTGAYYGDPPLRRHLASRLAHNGPSTTEPLARRLGTFLWGSRHSRPTWEILEGHAMCGRLDHGSRHYARILRPNPDGTGWEVEDRCLRRGSPARFFVRWQFAPGIRVEPAADGVYCAHANGWSLRIRCGEWNQVRLHHATPGESDPEARLEGVCSPSFRRVSHGAFLHLGTCGAARTHFELVKSSMETTGMSLREGTDREGDLPAS